jgi:hypothetical protein
MSITKFFANKFKRFARPIKIETDMATTPLKIKSTVYPPINPIMQETNINSIMETSKPINTVGNKKTTKHSKVKSHLINKGSITSLDAIELYGATRLSAIIFNLRNKDKMNIISEKKDFVDRYNNSASYSLYKYIQQ